jgi:ComF family protein
MLRPFTRYAEALLHMIYPHLCKGCAIDIPQHEQHLCAACLSSLPFTYFEKHADNPAEKIFFGRTNIFAAMGLLYFTKDSLVQSLVHQIKYEGAKELAVFMGKMMGRAILNEARFGAVDLLLPLPLTRGREKKRGYNQSTLLAEGISSVLQVPIKAAALQRLSSQGTQTHKSREERWLQMHRQFVCPEPDTLAGRHILLIDDVITTGATLDACASILNAIPGVKTSIATLAIAMK